MKYMVDIDGTICTTTADGNYEYAEPFDNRIKYFNELYENGHGIHYWTARGGATGKDWSDVTRRQFEKWGVKYTSLCFNKPSYDMWIDDKAENVETYFR
jgi:phosphatidate phosphatase PAH1